MTSPTLRQLIEKDPERPHVDVRIEPYTDGTHFGHKLHIQLAMHDPETLTWLERQTYPFTDPTNTEPRSAYAPDMNLGEWTDMHTLRDSAGSDVFKPWNEAVAGNAGNNGELCTIAIEDPPGVRLRYPSQDQRRLEFHILAEGSRGKEKVLITAVQLLRYNGNDNIQQFTLGTVSTWATGDDQDEPELPDDFKPF